MRGPTGAAGAEAYRFFCIAGAATTSDRFIELRGSAVQASEIRAKRRMPRNTTLTDLRVYFKTAHAVANATITVRLNGVDTGLSGVINASAQTLTVSGGSVSVVAGDALSVKIALSSAEANATLGVSVVVY
jgi:hypothetical protein